jgi:hypothetical protein
VCSFLSLTQESHGQAVKRICRYLAGTPNDGIKFSPNLKKDSTLHMWMQITLDTIAKDDQETLSASRVKNRFCPTLCLVVHHLAEQAQTEICLSSTASEVLCLQYGNESSSQCAV